VSISHRRTTVTAFAAAAFAALLPVASTAQAPSSSAMSGFRTIDSDHDLKLDKRELTAAAGRDFDRLDIDHDGYLTSAELKRTRDTKLLLPLPGRLSSASAFAAADTDRDNKIDKREYTHAIVQAYLACDRNADGTIEMSDLKRCAL
jgi:Ca2+-binding EF-hand superfamily protein